MESLKATTFTLFPQLPSELRLKIWGLIAPGPRTILVDYEMKYESVAGRRLYNFMGWRSPDPVPTVLHICHESRVEALKSYEAAFGSYAHPPKIYIDFDTDTVLFGTDPYFRADPDEPSDYLLDVLLGGEYCGSDDGDKIQRMVIDINESLYGRRPFCWDEIRLFPRLKELTIQAWEEDDMEDELMRRFRDTLGTVARKHPEWEVPDIRAVSVVTGKEWGNVKVPHMDQNEA